MMNRSLVIRLLQKNKNISRIELAAATGLERATISNIINDFIKRGMVSEAGYRSGKGGHKSIALELNAERYLTICVRIQRSEAVVGLFDISGVCQQMYPAIDVRALNPQTVMQKIIEQIGELLAYVEARAVGRVAGIGFALPGPYFCESERILLMTGAPGWERIDFREELNKHFDLPLFFEQDANCAAYAQWWYGERSPEHGSMLFLCAGPGIGAGFIEDGHLLRGSLGIAVEVGHMSININGPMCECGNRGCLELYSNVRALHDNAAHLLRQGYDSSLTPEDLSFDAIMRAIHEDDPVALRALNEVARALGFGLVNLVNIFNPDHIVVGDKLAGAGERLLAPIRDVLKEHLAPRICQSLEVYQTHFSDSIFLYGVNAMIWDHVLNTPQLFGSVFSPA